MKRSLAIVLVALLTLSTNTSISSAAVKAGATCKKAGQVSKAAGKEYTCIKKGKKLVWSKGVAIKAAAPAATPTPTPSTNPTPTPANFEPWSTNIDTKMLSDQAQSSFLSWVQTRGGSTTKHLQLIQDNPHKTRISILKKADDLGAQLFSSFFPQGSKTIIGATEAWTIAELTKSGWPARNCNAAAMVGVAYCLDFDSRQGYVITGEAAYDARNPGNDGGALLAHEYFHLVQASLSKTRPGEAERNKSTNASSVNAFPIWFIEGTAEFVGYSVGALAQNATYWEGRARMLSYSPPDESINKNAISDYEIRICCGNNVSSLAHRLCNHR